MTEAAHPALTVRVDPAGMQQRAANSRKALVRQGISAVIGTVVSGIFFLIYSANSGSRSAASSGRSTDLLTVLIVVAPALYGWIRLLVEIIRRHENRRALARLEPGQALRIERPGLVLRADDHLEFLRWEGIAAVRGVRRWDMPGPELRIERHDGTHWAVPFVLLDALPGSIDAGLRAYSGERFGLDMAACDDIW